MALTATIYNFDIELADTDRHVPAASLARHAREVPFVRDAQRDKIRMINAKLVRDPVDLAFFGRRDGGVCR